MPRELIHGQAGTAIQVDLEGLSQRHSTTVAAWFLECPGQSPAWSNYMLGVVHLRETEGVAPPKITLPGATHELLLYALDPDKTPAADDVETWHPLHPLNFVQQVILRSDDQARELAHFAAREITRGHLWAEPALSGQVEPWRSVIHHAALGLAAT